MLFSLLSLRHPPRPPRLSSTSHVDECYHFLFSFFFISYLFVIYQFHMCAYGTRNCSATHSARIPLICYIISVSSRVALLHTHTHEHVCEVVPKLISRPNKCLCDWFDNWYGIYYGEWVHGLGWCCAVMPDFNCPKHIPIFAGRVIVIDKVHTHHYAYAYY